ncbi:rhodanese-related sulfurtransferase [Tamlana haliotis]|uniref:tRNA uridine(34) hydroxylase n=1 Tax=Pseudotamlana haliotis TaxID=2614804 RepID=A0A6N6MBE3_9FLAO|nr:rhodanese-related sulfurtransferase [Tamlana haliotis]KAB1066835.1 rhodanese-related sulfurtransferase [Tamlana haliotis]
MQLYNKLSAKERAELIEKAGKDRLTLSFYQYAKIDCPQEFRDQLFIVWEKLDVLGRIYVATEGINAQLSLPADRFNDFKAHLDTIDFLKDIRLNIAVEQDNMSFLKLKVKVRNKIVADGLNDDTFDVTNKGVHLSAKEFNDMLANPNTVCVDMRNHYESEIGHFDGAVTPDVDTFRESLDIIEADLKEHKEEKNLLMYCTGGIRCEKASAYYKHKGFKNVFQLEGGIIEYTRQINEEGLENKFIGKNFVFDERRAEKISDDVIARCHQCGSPADIHTNCANDACHLLFIQCDSCKEDMNYCCSENCKEIHALPFEEQKALRKGQANSNDIFKKGRADHLPYKKDLRNIFETLKVDKLKD